MKKFYKIKSGDLQDANRRFVVSYYQHTLPGDVIDASKKNDRNNYSEIYQQIKNIFF